MLNSGKQIDTYMSKEEFLALAEKRYDAPQDLNKLGSFYDYEKLFVEVWQEFGRETLEKNLGTVPGNRRKKNFTTLGEVEIDNRNPFSKGKNGFQVSPRMQELMVFAGQLDCYGRSNEVIKQFLQVDVNAAQVYRITDTYGEELGKTVNEDKALPPVKPAEVLYAEVDGSMILTREEKWKEVKVGRLFTSSARVKGARQEPDWIRQSQYIAHSGDHRSFIDQTDKLIESYGSLKERLVFISDGAVWIRNWISDTFPEAMSVLDFYHTTQYLYAFAENYFEDQKQSHKWGEGQKKLLLNSQVDKVMGNIKKLVPNHPEAKKVIEYYQANRTRMDYKKYLHIGCGIIGSRAIESAHRTVVQRRQSYPANDGARKERKTSSI
jgi:hypothetical protein